MGFCYKLFLESLVIMGILPNKEDVDVLLEESAYCDIPVMVSLQKRLQEAERVLNSARFVIRKHGVCSHTIRGTDSVHDADCPRCAWENEFQEMERPNANEVMI